MRALSLWQPWASLVAYGEKLWETRAWHTNVRGRVAIHAAQSQDGYSYMLDGVHKSLLTKHGHPGFDSLPFGSIVAVVDITRCIPTEEWRATHPGLRGEYQLGNYSHGRFAIRLENLIRIEPLKCAGRQRFWNLTDEQTEEVERRMDVTKAIHRQIPHQIPT